MTNIQLKNNFWNKISVSNHSNDESKYKCWFNLVGVISMIWNMSQVNQYTTHKLQHLRGSFILIKECHYLRVEN